jgi:SRSO17 transposase
VLARRRWRRLTWRDGTKGPLSARFAAVRVKIADGVRVAGGHKLPGEAAWLVGERRATGETKYYLTSHPERTALAVLAAAVKARWSCERMHQQLKEELGLDHFEGRSWRGLHHHTLLTLISFAFLQHLRLQHVDAARGRGKNHDVDHGIARGVLHPIRAAASAVTPGDPPRAARAGGRRGATMSHVRRAARLPTRATHVVLAE